MWTVTIVLLPFCMALDVRHPRELPPKFQMAGISFTGDRYCPDVTMGSPEAIESLSHLASTGATWVAVIVTQYQWSINTTEIFPLYDPAEVPAEYYVYVTEKDEDLRKAIQEAHSLGLKVMLKPHVDPLTDNAPVGNTWRGDIGKFFNESQWDAWFDSYGQMLLRYAVLAESEGVEMMSMNCELIAANVQAERWRSLVNRTRDVFSGLITTAPNGHGHQFLVKWWDVVDIIGVDFYDHVPGETVDDMVKVWGPYIEQLEELHRNYSKPVVLTEIGYCSGPCDRDPSHTATEDSLQRQANKYEALMLASGNLSWFLGAFFWNWDTNDAFGPGDSCLTPQWKPAEDILRKYYRATQPQPPKPAFAPRCVGAGRCTK